MAEASRRILRPPGLQGGEGSALPHAAKVTAPLCKECVRLLNLHKNLIKSAVQGALRVSRSLECGGHEGPGIPPWPGSGGPGASWKALQKA